MENLYTPNCIRTFTGIYMNVFEPTPEMICIEDIAHALSNQCRFGGHLPDFYSVAQHSFLCSQTAGNEYKLQALLHDASEAYLLDIPKPIKQGLSNYKEIEDKLMTLIAEKFDFKYPLEKPVKQIDEELLKFEWEHIHSLTKKINSVLNNKTMTTEERESKSAEWRRNNLGKNAVSSGVSNFAFDPEKECYCNLCERHYKNYERFKIHMKKHYC